MKNKIIVIKVGSLAVSNLQGGVDKEKIANIVSDISNLVEESIKIILVSSGAINTGRMLVPVFGKKINEISKQQALSAVGQPYLMKTYFDAFAEFKLIPGQILVTHEDFKNRERCFNIKNTIDALLSANVIPIINENDTVSFDEITVGDNDQLACLITQVIQADKLIILTEADGLYDGPPQAVGSRKINLVEYDQDLSFVKFAAKTSVGRGGMKTKLDAIRKLSPNGIDVYLATYDIQSPIRRALNEMGGTLFKGSSEVKKQDKKSWMGVSAKTGCEIVIDKGANQALSKGASLLPVGILKVFGSFSRGDIVTIKFQRAIVGFGQVEFTSKELNKFKGLANNTTEAIHRNNLYIRKGK